MYKKFFIRMAIIAFVATPIRGMETDPSNCKYYDDYDGKVHFTNSRFDDLEYFKKLQKILSQYCDYKK